MVKGVEFHSIIKNVFGDVRNFQKQEQIQVNCPRCAELVGVDCDHKFNLEISTSKRLFRCWKCSDPIFSGSLGRLIKIYGSKADYEIYRSYATILGDYYHDEDEKKFEIVKLPHEMIHFSEMNPADSNHFEAYSYLVNERKIDRNKILKYRLGFCVDGKYQKRIIIPSYDSFGELNYFVGRTYDSKEKKRYDNPRVDKSDIIFNESNINWDSTVYLVEGGFELLSLGLNVIPLLGKIIHDTLLFKLKQFKPNLIIVLDPDAYKDSVQLFHQLKNIYVDDEDKIKIIKLSNGYDLDELIRGFNAETVVNTLRSARKLIIDDFFITTLKNDDKWGRRSFSSKDIEWKSGSTESFI